MDLAQEGGRDVAARVRAMAVTEVSGLSGPPAAEGSADLGSPGYFKVAKNRRFALLWAGRSISQSGDFVFIVAAFWYVLTNTRSIPLVALTGVAAALPALIIGPLIGVAVDRYNRPRIMIASYAAQGGVVAALVLVLLADVADGFVAVWISLFFLGVLDQLQYSASSALLPSMVSVDLIAPANGLLGMTASANQLAGSVVGVVVVALLGPVVSIGYDAATFFIAALLLLLPAFGAKAMAQPSPSPNWESPPDVFRELKEGLRAVKGSEVISQYVTVAFFVTMLAAMEDVLLAPYASLLPQGGAVIYGSLLAAVGVGTITASSITGRLHSRRASGRLFLLGSFLTGLASVLLGTIQLVPSSWLLVGMLGFSLTFVTVPMMNWIEATTNGQMLGRVYATTTTITGAGVPLGAVMASVLTSSISVPSVYLLAGTAGMLVTVVAAVVFPRLRYARY
jgi:MFS family permease